MYVAPNVHYTHAHMYICMYAHTSIHTYVCICTYTHMYVHTDTSTFRAHYIQYTSM